MRVHGWVVQQTKQERSQNGLQETKNCRKKRTEADLRGRMPIKSFTIFMENQGKVGYKLKQALILLVIASILMAIAGFVEVYLTFPIAEWIYSIIT